MMVCVTLQFLEVGRLLISKNLILKLKKDRLVSPCVGAPTLSRKPVHGPVEVAIDLHEAVVKATGPSTMSWSKSNAIGKARATESRAYGTR